MKACGTALFGVAFAILVWLNVNIVEHGKDMIGGNLRRLSEPEPSDSNSTEESNSTDDAVMSSSSESSDNISDNETAVYDDAGWHIEGDDLVAMVIQPRKLQPFYIMPIFFAGKLMLTMIVFGFGLSFKKKTTPNSCVAAMKKVVSVISGLAFIAMGLNGYRHDYARFKQHEVLATTWIERLVVFIAVWLTSSNYIACRAIWGALQIENPVKLLGLKPTYANLPLIDVPLCPGAAKWLNPLRHIYALSLIPYFLPIFAVQSMVGCAYCVWCCCTKCLFLLGYIQAFCCCCCALIGTVLTLGFWASSKSSLHYWWGLLQPIFIQVLIQGWASLVSPMLFAWIYGCLICSSPGNTCKGSAQACSENSVQNTFLSGVVEGAQEAQARAQDERTDESTAPEQAQVAGRLSADDCVKIMKLNMATFEGDFELPGDLILAEDEEIDDLEDAKVYIFTKTLMGMSAIILEQLSLLFLCRLILEGKDFQGTIACMVRTFQERTWASYTQHVTEQLSSLSHAASEKYTEALDVFWTFI